MNRFLAIILILIVAACKQDSPGEYEPSGQEIDGFDSLHFSYLQTGLQGPFFGVYFTDASNGYLAGYRAICHTTDGGLSWKAQVTPTDQLLYDIYFLDSQEGFAVGGQPGLSVMLHTKDGGATWEKTVLPASVKATLYSICFTDDATGFAVGEQSILTTHNRGLSWEETILTELQGASLYDVEFADAQKGLIGCSQGKVARTTDGGQHWTITTPFDDTQWYRLSKVDDHTVFIAGRSYMAKSENFGESWTGLPSNPGVVFALHFNNSKVGFAFGNGEYSGGDFGHYYGSIYYTRDGGTTWTADNMLTSIPGINACHFPTSDVGYAVGGNVVMKVERKRN